MKNSSLSFSLSNISQEALLHHRNYRFLPLASNGFDSKLVVVVVVLFVCLLFVARLRRISRRGMNHPFQEYY